MENTQPLIGFSKSSQQPVDALMVMLHGLGADGYDFIDLVPEFTQQFNIKVLLPHAPTQALTIAAGEKVPSWYDILATGDNRVINQDQLKISVQTVHNLILNDSSYGTVPVIIAGFSQGGAVALESFMTLPFAFAGCLAMSTYIINDPDKADRHINGNRPILMQHGLQDPVVNYTLGQRSAERIKAQGFSLEWQSYAMQHQVCIPQLKSLQTWLNHLIQT